MSINSILRFSHCYLISLLTFTKPQTNVLSSVYFNIILINLYIFSQFHCYNSIPHQIVLYLNYFSLCLAGGFLNIWISWVYSQFEIQSELPGCVQLPLHSEENPKSSPRPCRFQVICPHYLSDIVSSLSSLLCSNLTFLS